MKSWRKTFHCMAFMLVVAVFCAIIPARTSNAATISQKSAKILVGKTTKVNVTGTSISTVKSSNTSVAKVTKNTSKQITITGKKAGSATITVKCKNGKKYTCKVTVYIGLTSKSQTIYAGKSTTISLQGTTIKSVKSSNTSVAGVSKTSSNKIKITAKAEGKVTITVTGKNKKKYTCGVTVKPYISKSSVLTALGTTVNLDLKGAKISSVSSSNKTVATVKKISTTRVTVTAKNSGVTSITITTTKGKKLSCKVTVAKLNYNSVKLTATKTLQLKLINDTAKSFTSANKSIATVSSTGLVKAISKGSTKITVVSKNGKTYTCVVTVEKPVLNKTSGALLRGESYQLTLTGNNKPVSWSSSDRNIVEVDGNGRISSKNPGTCTIKAMADGVNYTCRVTVTTIDFNSRGGILHPEERKTIEVKQGGPKLSYTWESLNPDIATVNQQGLVTGVYGKGGKAKLRIKVNTMNGVRYVENEVNVTAASDLLTYKPTENNTYAKAKDNPISSDTYLSSGMNADIRLVENRIGECYPERFNHNNAIAYYHDATYNYYFVADTWNNRVLIYRCAIDDKWDSSTPIYSVLGQDSTTTNVAGYGLNNLNWPIGVAVGEDSSNNVHIFVTDTQNNRILVWDGIPSSNGVAADYAINYMVDPDTYPFDNNYQRGEGMINKTEAQISWPWAIWTDGEKLICTVTRSGYVAIWDQLPHSADKYPDKILYTGGTPRTIITDGEGYLILGDHNINTAGSSSAGARVFTDYQALFAGGKDIVAAEGDYIYHTDGLQPGGYILTDDIALSGGDTLQKGSLLLAQGGYLGVWLDGHIDSEEDKPDYYVGGGSIDDVAGYYFEGGDYNQLIQDVNGNLYMTLYNGCKVVGYASGTFPKEPADKTKEEIWAMNSGDTVRCDGTYYWYRRPEDLIEKHAMTVPNLCIGASNINASVEKELFQFQNCRMDSDGQYLVAVSDLHGALLLWKDIPDENCAKPDMVYKFNSADPVKDANIIDYKGKKGLMVGGTRSLMIWYDIKDALAGKVPDQYYGNYFGTVTLEQKSNYEFDGTYLYVACNKGVYMFEGFPDKTEKPVGIIDNVYGEMHVTNCVDGKTYLALGDITNAEGHNEDNSHKGFIYDRADILDGNKENGVIKAKVISEVHGALGNHDRFNLPSDVQVTENGEVLLCDGGFQRILIWDSIEDAVSGADVRYTIGLGSNAYTHADAGGVGDDYVAMQSENTFYSIRYMKYDGTYLWVGDFKFSAGMKRFAGHIK